jgi:chromosome segregation ATPase
MAQLAEGSMISLAEKDDVIKRLRLEQADMHERIQRSEDSAANFAARCGEQERRENEMRAQIQALVDEAASQPQREDLQREVERLHCLVEGLKDVIDDRLREICTLNDELARLRQLCGKTEALEAQINRLEAERLEQANAAHKARETLQQQQMQLSELRSAVAERDGELQAQRTEHQRLTSRINELDHDRKMTESAAAQLHAEIDEFRSSAAQVEQVHPPLLHLSNCSILVIW